MASIVDSGTSDPNFINKETPVQAFFLWCYESLKNSYFADFFWATASTLSTLIAI